MTGFRDRLLAAIGKAERETVLARAAAEATEGTRLAGADERAGDGAGPGVD